MVALNVIIESRFDLPEIELKAVADPVEFLLFPFGYDRAEGAEFIAKKPGIGSVLAVGRRGNRPVVVQQFDGTTGVSVLEVHVDHDGDDLSGNVQVHGHEHRHGSENTGTGPADGKYKSLHS